MKVIMSLYRQSKLFCCCFVLIFLNVDFTSAANKFHFQVTCKNRILIAGKIQVEAEQRKTIFPQRWYNNKGVLMIPAYGDIQNKQVQTVELTISPSGVYRQGDLVEHYEPLALASLFLNIHHAHHTFSYHFLYNGEVPDPFANVDIPRAILCSLVCWPLTLMYCGFVGVRTCIQGVESNHEPKPEWKAIKRLNPFNKLPTHIHLKKKSVSVDYQTNTALPQSHDIQVEDSTVILDLLLANDFSQHWFIAEGQFATDLSIQIVIPELMNESMHATVSTETVSGSNEAGSGTTYKLNITLQNNTSLKYVLSHGQNIELISLNIEFPTGLVLTFTPEQEGGVTNQHGQRINPPNTRCNCGGACFHGSF